MSLEASCEVATWWSSGWNWGELLRSISVTRTSSRSARRRTHPTPAKPPPTTTTCSCPSVRSTDMRRLRGGPPGAQALEQEDALARGGEVARQCPPSGAGSDHDHVVVAH